MTADARLTLVLGGARSGKSAHAERLVTALPAPWTYVATGQPFDDEMRDRIGRHRARRGADWATIEAPTDIVGALAGVPDGAPVLIDCLTLWLSNLLLADVDIEAECDRLETVFANPRGPWVLVSNEVGLGIVPDTPLGRRFRDEAGRLNQRIAIQAHTVLFLVAGIPVRVK